jgi:O-antigen ligase
MDPIGNDLMIDEQDAAPRNSRLRMVAAVGVILVFVAIQFSVAVGQSLLALTTAAWLVLLIVERRLPKAPRFFVPLLVYAAVTLVAAALSVDPHRSLVDCKQLVLLIIIPLTYDLMTAELATPAATAIMSAGAVSALVGIGQYAILHYDIDRRPHGTLGMYMTFSGLTMLVVGLALSQILFARRGRTWPALIVPALSVALAVTLSRNAWVGACAALALLLMLRDFRLLALIPVLAGVFFFFAPADILHRFYSIFDLRDLSRRDRVAMLQAGERMVRDHPLLGVGPDMVIREYPLYRTPNAVLETTPHLHNVPLQIAAERGLPALAVWFWFVGLVILDLWHMFRATRSGSARQLPTWLPAAGLASMAAMLAAGLFEYNFGDSEFLMLFLFLITLPFAAQRTTARLEPLEARARAGTYSGT